MALRSHTESFIFLRNKALKQRNFSRYDDDDDDEMVTLVRNDSNKFTDEDPNKLPDWISLVDEFRFECNKLNRRLEHLKDDQESYLRSKATIVFEERGNPGHDGFETDIEVKSQEISRLFSRLHGLIIEMKGIAAMSPTSKLLKNILQWEYKEISTLSQTFRSYQRDYLNRLNAREKYNEQFVINFDDVNPGNAIRSNGDAQMYDVGDEELATGFDNQMYQQDQMRIEIMESDFLNKRDQDMSVILKSVGELNQIFQEINTLVVNQGSLMDRIDYNIETVQLKVEQGAIELSKAERSARSARKLKCVMALAGTILLTLLILIIQS